MSKKTNRRLMRPLNTAIYLALLVPALRATASPTYVITDLTPALPLYGYSSGAAINNLGQVAGSSGNSSDVTTAVLWQPNGSMTNLGTLGGATSSANAINASGQVVGQSTTLAGTSLAFSSNGNTMTGLPTTTGINSSTASGVNNTGQIVGSININTNNLAALWPNSSTSPVILQNANAQSVTGTTNGINNNGLVVGVASISVNSQAFVYNSNATNPVTVTLQSIRGGNSQALAVNDAAQIVGNANTGNATNAVLWQTQSSAPLNLGTLGSAIDGYVYSSANAINDIGQVVGDSSTSASLSDAFFWYNSGGIGTMVNLNAIASGNSSSLILVNAAGINALGQITGTASTNSGDIHAFLATPTGTLNWTSSNSGAWDTATNWELGFVPNKFLDTVIAPATGAVTITGPAAAATVNSLTVGGGGGSATLNLASNLTVNNAINLLAGGTLALNGTGSLANSSGIVDNGSFDLSGTTSGTSIRSISGSGNVVLGSQTLTLTNASGTFSGVINGTGGLALNGGAETLAGTSTYTGNTTISGGVLTLGNTGSLASASKLSVSGGTFDIGGNSQTLAGVQLLSGSIVNGNLLSTSNYDLQSGTVSANLGGAVSLIKTGAGTLLLGGVNTYSGGTIVSAGTLQGNAASLQGNIVNNSAVIFDQATAGIYAGSLSGTGTFTKQGTGSLTLLGINAFGGNTTVAAGALINQGTLNAQGIFSNQANLTNQTGGVLTIADGGQMLNAGTLSNLGTVNLQGVWADSGTANATLNNQGTLNISGSGSHVINGEVINQGTVYVHETTVVYTGNFTNNGAYISDPSTSQFNNLSMGQGGYISAGAQDTFIVTGNFANASTQNAQWNTANSNLVFSSPSGQTAQHLMQLAGADKGASASGAVNNFAWGSLTLNNGNSLTLTAGSNGQGSALYARQVNLPGGVGELGNISSNYNIYYDPTVAQNGYLLGGGEHFGSGSGMLLPWSFVPFTTSTVNALGLTANERSFATALNQACASPNGVLASRCLELQGLGVPQQKQAILSLTPDQVPAQTGMNVVFGATRMDAPFFRLAALRAGGNAPFSLNINGIQVPMGKAANLFGLDAKGGGASADDGLFRDSPLGFFIQTRFNFADLDANPYQRSFSAQTRNVTAGADYRFSDQFVAGLAFNYTNVSTNYAQSAGNMNTDTYMGAVYGSYYFPKDFYVDWVANYGGNNYTFGRQFNYAGFTSQTSGNPTGNQYSFAVSSGKEFNWQEWLFNPYLRMEYLDMHVDSYQESGGAGFAMTTGGQTNHSFVSDLGMQISHALSLPWGVVTPAMRVEWEHQYLNDNRAIEMRISDASAGLGNFVIQTGDPTRDYVNLGGSLSAALPNGGGLFVRYETRLGQNYTSQHIVEAGVRLTF